MSYTYESDERAIARVIAALSDGETIDHGTARAIASQYNDGADTTVYAFVSTGAMPDEFLSTDRLYRALVAGVSGADQERNADALTALDAYMREREETDALGRVDGWPDMWVPRHVDYPHEHGQLDTCWCYEDDDS